MKAILSSALLLSCITSGLLAQSAGSGSITGTVTDASGSVVTGANVVVHNADTGVDQSLATNAAGIYAAAFLQPGAYDVTVTKSGFAKTERKGTHRAGGAAALPSISH